ncbi:MAG TPA: rod shape-determining protein MreC [Solirubrobacterales bacterium]|nr:rod shape-determining protein MreC [Solirubrobacterales bacterium]
MYRKQVRRRRAVLVVLVTASLILLSTQFTEGSGGPLHAVQRSIATVLGPLEEGAERALKPARDMFDWFGETFEARGELEELREETAELRKRVADSESAVGENKELRALLKLGPSGGIDGRQPVTARVIGRSPTVWYSTVTIDRGSSSDVHVDDPVITGDGLAGRVTETTSGTSQVTLITDHRSAVSAKVLPNGPSGVITPEVGDPGKLLLDFIEEDREVQKGRMVVTAGWRAGRLSSLFPYGIEIGKVTDATIDEQETYQRVHVQPFVDVREMEIVRVLTEPKGASDESQAATGETG